MKILKQTTKEEWTIYMLLFMLSGVTGFFYEVILGYFQRGTWDKRGVTYGPWITIYAIGGVLIFAFIGKRCDKVWKMFVGVMTLSGVIELLGGVILDRVFHIRLWNYNLDSASWQILNIGGYVCLRSVSTFGLLGLLVRYIMYPLIEWMIGKAGVKTIFRVSAALIILYIADVCITLVPQMLR